MRMTVAAEYQENNKHGENEIVPREYPIIHPTSDAPLCVSCQQLDLPFFDPSCPGCMEILQNPRTSISEIFAVIRQWMPQTQQNIGTLVTEILKRGAHVNDRDGLTDMTILHYICKAGAAGVGDVIVATKTFQMLLEKKADIHLKCRWTDMTALHYAAYFDVVPIMELLLGADPDLDLNISCLEFDGGSPLHIAAINLCVEAVKFLVKNGADITQRDKLKRTPYDCIPELSKQEIIPDIVNVVSNLKSLLKDRNYTCELDTADYSTIIGRTVLKSLRLKIGDKVIVGGAKRGILKYCGVTKFASGIWAGVELEESLGKNDGTVGGITYFKSLKNHGIFAPISKICKYNGSSHHPRTISMQRSLLPRHINHPKIDISRITSKIETGLIPLKSQESKELVIGDKVYIGRRNGILRYIGETEFASGTWCGVELDKPQGKNNGCVQGVKYFTCKENRGLFVPYNKISKLSRHLDDTSSEQSSSGLNSSHSRSSTDGENELSSSSQQSSTRLKKKRYLNDSGSVVNNFKECWLITGMNVLVNNEIATVRYIGKVMFADGVWLGVELRKPKGKNDGNVQGHRYFTCKPHHGLMVRPNRVTIRGINGSKLIPVDA